MKPLLLLSVIFFSLLTFGQNKKPNPVKEPPHITAKRAADTAFKNGDYKRAEELYRFCSNLIYVEDLKGIRERIKLSQELNRKKQLAMNLFVAEKYIESGNLYQEILQSNPADDFAKKGVYLSNLPAKPTKEEEKILAYVSTLPKQKALTFLESYYPIKPSNSILIAINRLQTAGTISNISLDVATNATEISAFESQMRSKFKDCDYDGTIKVARKILKVKQYNSLALQYKTRSEVIQRKLSENAALAHDPSKDGIVQANYDYIFKRAPNCIRTEYFTYLFDKGKQLYDKGLCKEPLPFLLKAKEIAPLLARQKNIDWLISEIRLKCEIIEECNKNKMAVQSYMIEATNLFQACRFEEALSRYELAKTLDCDAATRKIIDDWQSTKTDIESQMATIRLFNKTMQTADSLMFEANCKEALTLYKSANDMQVKCGKLGKQILANRIKRAQECIQKKCFEENNQLAVNSERGGYMLDAITHYCKALECADSLQNQIVRDKICAIVKKINNSERPGLSSVLCINCPPIIPQKDTANYKIRPEIVGIGYGYQYGNLANKVAFAGGLRFKLVQRNPKNPFWLAFGANYISNEITGASYTIKSEQLALPLTMYVNVVKRKDGRVVPFVFGEYQFVYLINSEYSSGGQTLSGRKYFKNQINSAGFGVGIEHMLKNKKWGYSLEFFNEYLLDEITSKTVYFSIPDKNLKRNSYGVRLGIRIK